jgi:hypothetical protein
MLFDENTYTFDNKLSFNDCFGSMKYLANSDAFLDEELCLEDNSK